MNNKFKTIELPYGEDNVNISLPESNISWIKSPNNIDQVFDVNGEIRNAIRNPIGIPDLKDLVKIKGDNVVILVDDMTRSTPQKQILPILLDELNNAGVADEKITAIIALGTHRKMTKSEIIEKYGQNVVNRIKFINHDCYDNNNLVKVTSDVYVNKIYYDSDISIAVGNIVPHMYAGWSGGGKMIQPGVCGAETTGKVHFLASEKVHQILGCENNIVREEIEKIAQLTGLTMIINTVLNKEHKIVKVVAGHFIKAHRKALCMCRKVFEINIDNEVDILIASANPAYLDFWQSVKAYNNCSFGVKKNGILILLCSNPEGIAPDHPDFVKLGKTSRTEAKKAYKNGEIKDQVALSTYLAMSINREKLDTYLYSEGINKKQAEEIGLKIIDNINDFILKLVDKYGSNTKIGIITHGADIIIKKQI